MSLYIPKISGYINARNDGTSHQTDQRFVPDDARRRARPASGDGTPFVRSGTGINDDLNGTERAVRFAVPALGGADVEIVHSLAKWKRIQLGAYGIPAGFGLYTDMNAVRADEELDNIHSIYVDQWDWERTIRAEDRNLEFLKGIVRRIYSVIRSQERRVYETYRHITPVLPEEIVSSSPKSCSGSSRIGHRLSARPRRLDDTVPFSS